MSNLQVSCVQLKKTCERRSEISGYEPAIRIIAAAFALAIVGIALRIKIFLPPAFSPSAVEDAILNGIINSRVDLACVAVATSVCLLLVLSLRRKRACTSAIAWTYMALAVICVVMGCVNLVALNILGGPITFQLISYADLFRSFTARSSILPVLNFPLFVLVTLALAGGLVTYSIAANALKLMGRRWIPAVMSACILLPLPGLIPQVRASILDGDTSVFATNPLLELFTSALASNTLSADGAIPPQRLPLPSLNANMVPFGLGGGVIRNVLVVVMESVGARFIPGIGPPRWSKFTPRIASRAENTLAFTDIYAHSPVSSKELYSLVSARYPLFMNQLSTNKYPNISLPTLSGRLKQAGLCTAFFMSGDFAFEDVDKFLAGRSFDVLSDMTNIECDVPLHPGSTVGRAHLESVDDSCSATALKSWIDAQSGQPFFAILWTGNTHWPYAAPDGIDPTASTTDPNFNRYLAALRSSDAAIGSVLDHLAKVGLSESTLVVILGDHGEAFGEHGDRTHGSNIYDEQTHIPLLLMNPLIKKSSVDKTVGGMVDVAPTILHVLGLPAEPSWDGRSLFDSVRADRVFMMAPNQGIIVGYREGNKKFIYKMRNGKSLAFDLANDPEEIRDITDEHSAAEAKHTVAGWLLEQNHRNADVWQ
jgi:lipoteichoic acid synthase